VNISNTGDSLPNKPTNVLIVGVGGQGVIMVSKVLARLAQVHDLQVKQSEVHGMAKRGGSVFSHVRFGKEVWSPTIAQGEADVLVALEWAEGLRWLRFLNAERGTFIADTKMIVPPFSCLDRQFNAEAAYPEDSVAEVVNHIPATFALDATSSAQEMGNERVANTILLGVLATALDFPDSEWLRVLAEIVPPHTLEANELAFHCGKQWAKRARKGEALTHEVSRRPKTVTGLTTRHVSFQIIEQWCKGCDIWGKTCPGRCLVLNDQGVGELVNPDACTGCRVCEWLCPDFAIKIKIDTSVAPSGEIVA